MGDKLTILTAIFLLLKQTHNYYLLFWKDTKNIFIDYSVCSTLGI